MMKFIFACLFITFALLMSTPKSNNPPPKKTGPSEQTLEAAANQARASVVAMGYTCKSVDKSYVGTFDKTFEIVCDSGMYSYTFKDVGGKVILVEVK